MMTTHIPLSREAVRLIRKADRAVLRREGDNDHGLIRLILGEDPQVEAEVRCRSRLDSYDGDRQYCSTFIYARWSPTWQTFGKLCRMGDSLVLHFTAANDNGNLKESALSADEVSVQIWRKDALAYELMLHYEVSPKYSTMRMCREAP